MGNSNRPNKRGTNSTRHHTILHIRTWYTLYLDKFTKIGFQVWMTEGTLGHFAQNYNPAQNLTRKVLLEELG